MLIYNKNFSKKIFSSSRILKRGMAIITDLFLCVFTLWLAFYLRLEEFIRINDETILDEVVDQDMVDEPDELERVEGANIDPDGMCWNRGNWLSFLANIPGQMKYLGPLPWIW